jgi:plasmid maintenance system killer protein
VILSYRDERTRDLVQGKRIKAFSGIERPARLKLDRLEAATSTMDLPGCLGIGLKPLKENGKGNTAYE